MSESEMLANAKKPWNKLSQLPHHEWLTEQTSAQDGHRLKCLGNIVIPACARLAMHILRHSFASNPDA